MNKIEIKVLNPEVIKESEKMMVCAARLTQRGHEIKNLNDFMALYSKDYSASTIKKLVALPHPTIQKFGAINVVVVGASRRFLAQITRHQNEVKFMSASLQYSDYSGEADFTIPYGVLSMPEVVKDMYLDNCAEAMDSYQAGITYGLDNDSAGYMAPQGLRNILIISATPYQWKHIISQRICKRNTAETRYVLMRIWEALYEESPLFFSPSTTGPFCMHGECKEGSMACGHPYRSAYSPSDLIKHDFPLLT